MENYYVIKGIIKTAEEITNKVGALTFRGKDAEGEYVYHPKLNALKDFTVDLTPITDNGYDYLVERTGGIRIREEWLKSKQVSVNWDLIPIDMIVETSMDEVNWYKMHFARYEPDSLSGRPYLTFAAGRSSKTALLVRETTVLNFTNVLASTLSGKYFLVFSETNNYYVWFNLDNSSADPGSLGRPLFDLGYIGLKVDYLSGETLESILGKVASKITSTGEFTANQLDINMRTIELTYKNTSIVKDANAGIVDNLVITVGLQGGDVISWPFARLPI